MVTLDSNGVEDTDMVNQTLDPSTAEGYTWPVILKHEGTEQQSNEITYFASSIATSTT